MYPKLFELGAINIYTYGVLLAAAYLTGLQVALIRARRRGLDPNRVMDLGIYIIISALIGAKLMLLIVEFEHLSFSWAGLWALVRSGGIFYGGLFLGVPVALWYMRRHRMPTWTTFDIFAPGIALGHAIGRIGCLMAGCCFGRPTSVAWGITFTSPLAASNVGTPLGVTLHPTQLYESGVELFIFAFLLLTERRGRPFPGRTFWGYALLYGIARFIIELYRGDPRGTVFDVLSTSQFLSILVVPLSLVMLLWLSRQGAPEPGRAGVAR